MKLLTALNQKAGTRVICGEMTSDPMTSIMAVCSPFCHRLYGPIIVGNAMAPLKNLMAFSCTLMAIHPPLIVPQGSLAMRRSCDRPKSLSGGKKVSSGILWFTSSVSASKKLFQTGTDERFSTMLPCWEGAAALTISTRVFRSLVCGARPVPPTIALLALNRLVSSWMDLVLAHKEALWWLPIKDISIVRNIVYEPLKQAQRRLHFEALIVSLLNRLHLSFSIDSRCLPWEWFGQPEHLCNEV